MVALFDKGQLDMFEHLKDRWVRRSRLTEEQYVEKRLRKGLAEDGSFIPDPEPIAPPVGWTSEPSLSELVARAVQSESLKAAAENAGMETLEEADDFDIDDDYALFSGYENEFDDGTGIDDVVHPTARESDDLSSDPGAPGGGEDSTLQPPEVQNNGNHPSSGDAEPTD